MSHSDETLIADVWHALTERCPNAEAFCRILNSPDCRHYPKLALRRRSRKVWQDCSRETRPHVKLRKTPPCARGRGRGPRVSSAPRAVVLARDFFRRLTLASKRMWLWRERVLPPRGVVTVAHARPALEDRNKHRFLDRRRSHHTCRDIFGT
jgi:hypothetical protein